DTGENKLFIPCEGNKYQRRSGQCRQAEFQPSFRQSHAIKLGYADSGKKGHQAGKENRTTLQDDQDDDWQQDDR
ncbi:MAG: hypothetical protein HGB35_02990, partial [Geobacteraceae bacterium]|nr:hypothetical protein [Geobacteraceae bacterium]